jgi:hypothetical protein
LTPEALSSAAAVCLSAAGLFLLTGLLIGVWKYWRMLNSPDHRAPAYVDIAHRAALLYSFASLTMMKLVEYSPYPQPVQLAATSVPIVFFAAAVASYVWHGVLEDTDNQFEQRSFVTTWGMVLLIAGEIGGISVLVWGFFVAEVL